MYNFKLNYFKHIILGILELLLIYFSQSTAQFFYLEIMEFLNNTKSKALHLNCYVYKILYLYNIVILIYLLKSIAGFGLYILYI